MGLALIGNMERLGERSTHGAVLKGNLPLCFQNKHLEEVEKSRFAEPNNNNTLSFDQTDLQWEPFGDEDYEVYYTPDCRGHNFT